MKIGKEYHQKLLPMKKYDLFIIGTGVAGTAIANKCASNGLKVGIIDDREYGGACALRGCIPKKVLVNAVQVSGSVKNLLGKGVKKPLDLAWGDLKTFMDSFTDPMPSKKEENFREKGIDTFHGKAVFVSDRQMKIGEEIIEAEKFVITTGAKTRELSISGAHFALNSDDFFKLEKLPKSILFIGGGYIAMEFAHIVARFGVKVTIVDRLLDLLPNFDQNLVLHLIEVTKKVGIELVMDTKLNAIHNTDNGYVIIGEKAGEQIELTAEMVFNTTGRIPAIFDLDLENANVAFSEKGIEVNEFMQSVSNPRIYAAGDNTATKGLPLTPFANMEGHIVASNILEGNNKKPDYSIMPTVIFTLPPLAMVGITEKQANEEKLNYRISYDFVPEWYSAKHRGEKTYAYKVIIEKESDFILGAHLIGSEADETITLFALAMKTKMKAQELKLMPFIFPSSSSDVPHML